MVTHTLINVRFTGRKALALIALVFAAVFPLFSYGAIAFDAAGSTSATNAASVTWSHTVGSGSNRMLVVGLSTEDTSTSVLAVNSITYNGVALTAVSNATATDGTSTFDRTQLFYLFNPPAGSHTVSVTFGGAVNGVSAGSVSLSGVAQNAPSAAATGILDSGSALSTSVAVSTAGSWLVDAVCSGASSATFTASDSAMTKRWGTSQSNSGGAGATKVASAVGTSSMSWTASNGGRMAQSVAVFAPAAGATATAPVISTPPASQTVTAGSNVTFSVVASGTAPLTYQWKFNGTNISGATSASITLTNVQSANAGSYTVTVLNTAGSATSAATLTVNAAATAPVITTQPASQTVTAGNNVTFNVVASGTAPLSYQWSFNGAAISGATSASLTLTNVQSANAGSYTVTVSNSVGPVTSNVATLTVNTPATAPVITTQPASQTVVAGGNATFSVVASGTAPLSYLWSFNGTAISGATSASLTLTNVQSANAGSYAVTVSNSVSPITSNPATLTVTTSTGSNTKYNLTGFATLGAGTTGGGIVAETDAAYRKVTTPLEFANAIIASNKTAGAVKVIEIMNDLNLGWNEIGTAVQTLSGTPFRAHATPKLHPVLITSGVSLLDIKAKSGLTIFSANGATIKHVNFNLKGTSNIIIRNLKFDEMWEWDEATKGNYDSNDWDFLTLSNGSAVTNVWVDHCTFTKSYDGILDQKAGTQNITMSWCKYMGDDGATNSNSFVRKQINVLEANRSSYTFYNFLRTNGFSVEDIVAIIQGQDKTHLMGSNSLDSENATLSATFHHQWFTNMWDRCVPRLRAGNVHNYDIYVDDTGVLAAKRLRDTRAAAMSTSVQNTLNNTYNFNPPINGSISTESGAILVEKSVYMDCLWPLRNNQTDITDPTYTGKIQATDTIYVFHNTDGTTTTVRGNSTDSGNPLGPFQAPVIAFAWNGFTSLPYAYTTHDPSNLQTLVTAGAGAGALTWSKDNWLKISY